MATRLPPANGDERVVLTPKLVIGAGIAFAGAVLALDNLNLLNARTYLRYWPVVVILIGALMIRRARDEGGGLVGGSVVAAVGAWLLLNTLDIVDVGIWQFFWPIVLMTIGTSLVLQTLRRGRVPALDPSGTPDLFAIMSGTKHTSTSPHFRGADMTAFMGGCELDLRQASMPEGGSAAVDVLAVMGGHEIKVPADWRVISRVVCIMGGVDDKAAPPAHASAPVLVLRGLVFMGGVEIRN